MPPVPKLEREMLKPLVCNFPCPCTKCKNNRNKPKGELQRKTESRKNPDKFLMYTTETISILTFIIFSILMVWIWMSKFALQIAIRVYKSDKNTKIVIATLLALLVLSISVNLVITKAKRTVCPYSKSSKQAAVKQKEGGDGMYSRFNTKSDTKISVTPKNPTAKMWEKPAKVTDKNMQNKNITVTITDNRSRELFRQSKLFAVSSEMKQPPALLVYLHNVILKNY